MGLPAQTVIEAAHAAGFELAGITPALPIVTDFTRYRDWVDLGLAGRMGYLTDHRADVRSDPRNLLPSARSILCVGKLYNTPYPPVEDPEHGRISRYAWGEDYHDTIRARLESVDRTLRSLVPSLESRICVDTAPLLERSYARLAGLGWIGKNTCLINQQRGSWFLLGELLLSADCDSSAAGSAPPDRCGSCTRCIDACPTAALVPSEEGGWKLDARLCISYFTIELKSAIPEEQRAAMGNHVFGCDICQDVCPWNRRSAADVTTDSEFQPRDGAYAADLERLLFATPEEFRLSFKGSPVSRARYTGFLRNVAVAMGNSGSGERFREPLQKLLERAPDEVVREHARWALGRLAP